MSMRHGRTVAHEAASSGHLPAGFDRWELTDQYSQSVAQVVYERGALPEGFASFPGPCSSGSRPAGAPACQSESHRPTLGVRRVTVHDGWRMVQVRLSDTSWWNISVERVHA
jgi:hypothetical protein